MFKPRGMRRTLIIGAKYDIEKTIDLLHSLEVAHIIDYKPSDDAEQLQLGAPTGQASGVSQRLLTLRSSSQLLALDRKIPVVSEKIPEKQIQRITNAENNIKLPLQSTKEQQYKQKTNQSICWIHQPRT